MASSKRIGFYWGEEKITVVEFDKNTPLQVVFSPLGSKANTASPFSSNLTEEIQITAILQKMMQDNNMMGGSFYVSLPMKEIILRSFVVPLVKPDEIQNVVKFESKKYMPFDIQDLSYVFHTIPFSEGLNKRLQVIFFAARKEVLARYERIFKQVNAEVSYCEPYMVSLSKALLFQKEVNPSDHFAFLILDKNLGRISFIDKGIPQFIREFPMKIAPQAEGALDLEETLNAKIVNEVGNSYDFYARQFNGERIEKMLVASDFVQKDLLSTLETELKVTLTKYSPVITTGTVGQSNDMDAVYAMGACISPPVESLSDFNFLADKKGKPKSKFDFALILMPYKGVMSVLLLCAFILAGIFVFFQAQLKSTQKQYDLLSAKQGVHMGETKESLQAVIQHNTELLTQYKNIRMKSEMAFIILKLASHLPQGSMLSNLRIAYDKGDASDQHVSIDMTGNVYNPDPNEQIAAANQIYSDFKHDKDLLRFVKIVSLVSLTRQLYDGKQVTVFTIHCS